MSNSVPLKSLHPTTESDTPCPSYAEDASSAAESQPFINLSEHDVEAASPPAYAENSTEEAPAKKDPLEGKSPAYKAVVTIIAIFMGIVGFGFAITLVFAFFKFLGFLWRKLGLI
ncbi:hypothetical protein F4806DRAFT_469719 [Annulohypoxylon nitens]|nr:hypothetical protein F4806DRAFT_469719 [Annulohypoxylon nitens]